MILRPAIAADAGQVADVDLAARTAALPNVRWAHTPQEIRRWIADTLIPSGAVHVADERGTLLGYMTLRDAWVDQLYVHPGNWRRGVGSLLLRMAMDRHPRGLSLYCFQCNPSARRFYEHHGFAAIGFSDGEENKEREPDILFSWPGWPRPGAARRCGNPGRAAPVLPADSAEERMAIPDADKTSKLWGLIKDIRFAMMTSEDGEVLRSRPMAASQREFDGNLWFFTRLDSAKVREVHDDDRVGLSYADPDRQNYVSISGRARLVRDPDALRAHWSEAVRVWFPKGLDDPDLALLKVEVQQAEYWDAPSSAMVHAYGYARAVLTGTPPQPGKNEKLSFE